ncbi:MAG: transposase [Saprospiraceae bacterium]
MGHYKIVNQHEPHFLTLTTVGWIDIFTRQVFRDLFLDSIRYCQREKGLVINAWVIMSNHVHLVARTEEPHRLSDVLRDMKKFTARKITEEISGDAKYESRREWLAYLTRFFAKHNARNHEHQLWQQYNCPMEVNTIKFAMQKINYIHNNPVKAGIVRIPDQYIYSSACDYMGRKGLIDVEIIEAAPGTLIGSLARQSGDWLIVARR